MNSKPFVINSFLITYTTYYSILTILYGKYTKYGYTAKYANSAVQTYRSQYLDKT